MLLKLLQTSCRLRPAGLLQRGVRVLPHMMKLRRGFFDIPPSQYDIPLSDKFKPSYVLRVYWELIPIFVTTAVSISLVILMIAWACKNKVDVVFSTHSCNNISRTMDLRHPTVHKIVIINQRYDPWPEMQDVLDKMRVAERKLLLRATTCSFAAAQG